ncbi:MAG: hypothetical protein GY795_40225 [Desulfobacterales bacterium]|nr:hypothetical protein [Desulfobacterales bacterium]
MSQNITISLSDSLYRQVRQISELSRQPTEAIIIQSLTHALPSLLEDIPIQYQADVYPLLQMNDAELQCESRRIFPQEQWLEYEALLDKKKTGKLTDQEEICLDRLRHEADVLMFRRSYAAVLLKRRCYLLQKAATQ